MSKLCRHTVDPRLSNAMGPTLVGYAKCSDMQKQACRDTAYISSPISGTSFLTLCKMADLESTKF